LDLWVLLFYGNESNSAFFGTKQLVGTNLKNVHLVRDRKVPL
jgi:hypothetical protein